MMKYRIWAIVWFLFITILLFSCSRRETKDTEPDGKSVPPAADEVSESGEGRKAGRKGVEDAFNPEAFVKVTIEYRRESKIWLEESRALPPEEQPGYIEESNRIFFESRGLTEEEYTTYSQIHQDELNAYMEEHPELLPLVMQE